jgi:CheY-like chemotaxis protein
MSQIPDYAGVSMRQPFAEGTNLETQPEPSARIVTVLVVDDNAHMREFAAEVLAESGYAVLTAAICGYALRLIGQQPIDILFTDIVMPGMNGFALAHQAKLIRPSLQVLYATGYARNVDDRGTRALGPMLAKPYHADQLLDAISRLVTV